MVKAGLLALGLAFILLLSWEGFWRSRGYEATFNDDKALWATQRKKAYLPKEKSTVFIGSSRIKFDLDLPTWREKTGETPVQLSLVGTSPLLLLKDLAEDVSFSGKLVVDITEVLFFSKNPAFHKSAQEAIAFYHDATPSEEWSARIGFGLESQLVFLEERRFALNTLLNDLQIPDRPGVFSFPSFPKGFEWTTYDRQTYMSRMFLTDSQDLATQTGIWEKLIMGDPTPAVSGKELEDVLLEIKAYVDKIRSRGGRVIFVRTPSSGPMATGEEKKYPRKIYWDALLDITKTEGIHFKDHPVSASMICPEWSHLSPADAVSYTKLLVQQLRDKNWFQPKP